MVWGVGAAATPRAADAGAESWAGSGLGWLLAAASYGCSFHLDRPAPLKAGRDELLPPSDRGL